LKAQEIIRMEMGFLGGLGHNLAEPTRTNTDRLTAWNGRAGGLSGFLHGWGLKDQLFLWDGLALLVRGYLRVAGSREPLNRERVAGELRWRYLEEGLLDLAGFEGNATVVLLDSQTGQAFLARPLNSSHSVYFQATATGLVLGSNLAEVAALSGKPLQVDPAAVAAWLDLGTFPDCLTLFQNVGRLPPGELLIWTTQGLQRGDLPRPADPSPVVKFAPTRDRLAEVVRDCAALAAHPVHLLTGSLAAVALQTLRNQELAGDEMLPATASLCLDAPPVWDQTDAIMQASLVLGTGHALIPAPTDAAAALRETLAATGEPSAAPADWHLSFLAEALRTRGHTTVILDAGGDAWPPDPAACWRLLQETARTAACFEQAGLETLCPLLDSRLFPGCDYFNLTRSNLVREMSALVPRELRRTPRPVSLLAELLQPGKPLWPLVERVRTHDLVSPETLDRARARPTEWLYRLLCYDLWHQVFIDGAWRKEQPCTNPLRSPTPC
jgi:hypothetical protein